MMGPVIGDIYFHANHEDAFTWAVFQAHFYGIRQVVRKHHTRYWSSQQISEPPK